MKKNRVLILLAFIAFYGTSCFNPFGNRKEKLAEDDFELVEINDEYSMNIPKYMEKATDLNDEASLQYQNTRKETYIIVIDEIKQDIIDGLMEMESFDTTLSPLQNYRKLQMDQLEQNIKIKKITEPRPERINDLDAEMIEMDAKAPEVLFTITYFLTFIESPEKIYMVMGWTMQARKEKYRDTFEQTIRSFKVISNESTEIKEVTESE